ncbi:phosphoenolpyruvate carboxykinase (ATP) [Desulfohalotomaculum tongense]|uniref:phosphoenolpyruvate carboxykinase (ATP) n=1 Tax=Desulforadius tongensis TaxID=1216062 RepID=UPI00195641A5|nr:phosphoenolpyruvate carboxykinase (ATP) [Desulforadius tongensis]MBM7854122.1 phosphoenolpyruvate carboxykinase (ATP) [Desulforadius tongensis]
MDNFRRKVKARRVYDNPTLEELRKMAVHEEKTTQYGSASYVTEVRNRSAKHTYIVNAGEVELGVDQKGISLEKANSIANAVHRYLEEKEIIKIDRQMGRHNNFNLHCRLYITKDYARIPLQWTNMLFEPRNKNDEPELVSIYVPEWPQRIIFCHPEAGVTYILGTDYFGECKKSFLRKAMYKFKKQGGLGFHAGSKVLRVKDGAGHLKEVGFIMFGLSGTGKTTLTMHDHGLTGQEGVAIRQDDVIMMNKNGYCYGTENGFYIKTDGLDQSQRVLYKAATSSRAVFENIMVGDDGIVDFNNSELTSNGRGVVLRSEVEGTDDKIDLEKAHRIIFITRRNDIVPAVAKLTPEQAAAYFMLGESIETSAGDPDKAGQSKRCVGTNPFIIGKEADEGNRLLEILRANPDMECYVMNTGSVGSKPGQPGIKITIQDSTNIMKHLAKGNISWVHDPDWGYMVPREVPEVDMDKLNPVQYYTKEEYRELVEKLRTERRRWLAKYKGLNAEILQAIEK